MCWRLISRFPASRSLAVASTMLALFALPAVEARAQAVPSDDAIYAHVEKLVGMGVRVPGSPASRAASEYIHSEFIKSGLEGVAFQEADTLVWHASQWGLSVNGKPVPTSPMLHTSHTGQPGSFSTGQLGVNAPLMYVGKGSSWDFMFHNVRGKIVVADAPFSKRPLALYRPFVLGVQDAQNTFPWNYQFVDPYSGGDFPGNYYRAMKAGAVGFVGILVDYHDSHQYRNEAYKSYDPGMAMAMPALWVSPVDGAALVSQIRAAKASMPLMANFKLDGRLTQEKARGVYGILPGMSDETVLIQSHHDSSTAGAVEDATGAAEVLALARYFGQLPKASRPRTLMFATMDTHFTDYAVHKAFANQHLREPNPSGRKVLAALTIEHIGNEFLKGPDGKLKATGRVAPRGMMVSTEVKGFKELALDTMRTFGLERTVAVSTSLLQLVGGSPGLPADSSDFLKVGVPVIAFVGAPLYLYDEADTLDKVAKQDLNKVARAFAHMVERISAMPSSHFKRLPDKSDF